MSVSNLSFNWGKNDKKTLKIFKVAFGQQIMGRTQVFEWLSKLDRSVKSEMCNFATKFMPDLASEKQKENHMNT